MKVFSIFSKFRLDGRSWKWRLPEAVGCESGFPRMRAGRSRSADAFAAAEGDGVLDGGAQFADVARPIVALQRVLGIGGKTGDPSSGFAGRIPGQRR